MKNILSIIILLYSGLAVGQTIPNPKPVNGQFYTNGADTSQHWQSPGAPYKPFRYPAWVDLNIPGFTITSAGYIGQVITTGNPSQVLKQIFGRSMPPTSGLSGGVAIERVAPGANLSYNLSWSYGRQSATVNILSAIITGASQSYNVFSIQPAQSAQISGSQTVGVPRNVTTTFSILVSTDETPTQTSGQSTTFSFYDKRYLGFATNALQGDGTPTDGDVLAATYKDNQGGNTVISGYVLAQQSSDKYLFFISTNPVTSIKINGFPSTAAFNLNIQRSLVNASGGSTTYYFTVSKNAIGSALATTVDIN